MNIFNPEVGMRVIVVRPEDSSESVEMITAVDEGVFFIGRTKFKQLGAVECMGGIGHWNAQYVSEVL